MASNKYGLVGIGDNVELGKEGLRIRSDSGGVEVRNNIDNAYVPFRAGDPVADDDLVTKRYLETHSSLIVSGQIDGGSPPAPGTLGRVFIVTTAGGAYSLKEIWRDDGVAWVEITVVDGFRVSIADDLTGGTDEYLGNHVYLWDADTSAWIDVGPITANTKMVKNERVSLGFADTGINNIGAVIPTNAVAVRVIVNVTQVFNGTTPVLKVGDGVSDVRLMAESENNLKKIGAYITETPYLYGAPTQLIATLTIGGVPGTGVCLVLVEYDVP